MNKATEKVEKERDEWHAQADKLCAKSNELESQNQQLACLAKEREQQRDSLGQQNQQLREAIQDLTKIAYPKKDDV